MLSKHQDMQGLTVGSGLHMILHHLITIQKREARRGTETESLQKVDPLTIIIRARENYIRVREKLFFHRI